MNRPRGEQLAWCVFRESSCISVEINGLSDWYKRARTQTARAWPEESFGSSGIMVETHWDEAKNETMQLHTNNFTLYWQHIRDRGGDKQRQFSFTQD